MTVVLPVVFPVQKRRPAPAPSRTASIGILTTSPARSGSPVQSNRNLNETVGGMNLLTSAANKVGNYQLRTWMAANSSRWISIHACTSLNSLRGNRSVVTSVFDLLGGKGRNSSATRARSVGFKARAPAYSASSRVVTSYSGNATAKSTAKATQIRARM